MIIKFHIWFSIMLHKLSNVNYLIHFLFGNIFELIDREIYWLMVQWIIWFLIKNIDNGSNLKTFRIFQLKVIVWLY